MMLIIMIITAMPLTNMWPAMMIVPNQPATMPVVAHPPPIITGKSANLPQLVL